MAEHYATDALAGYSRRVRESQLSLNVTSAQIAKLHEQYDAEFDDMLEPLKVLVGVTRHVYGPGKKIATGESLTVNHKLQIEEVGLMPPAYQGLYRPDTLVIVGSLQQPGLDYAKFILDACGGVKLFAVQQPAQPLV